MFFSPWYNSMLVIIFATAFYQKYWMKVNGYTSVNPSPMSGKILTWSLALIPILNTMYGLLCLFLLWNFTFKEEDMVKIFDNSSRFKKI